VPVVAKGARSLTYNAASTGTGRRELVVRGLGATPTGVLQLGADVDTAALFLGGGTAASRLTTAVADKNFLGLWTESTATSGDSRGLYLRHYIKGAGGSGEAIRGYATIDGVAAAVGGTVNGAHISLKIATGGSVSGAGNALRATLETDASVAPGGTLAVIRADTSFGASATVPDSAAFIALDNLGTPKLSRLLSITNPDTTAMFVNAGTGANSAAVSTGGVAAKVLKVSVGGVDYWLPLFSSNS